MVSLLAGDGGYSPEFPCFGSAAAGMFFSLIPEAQRQRGCQSTGGAYLWGRMSNSEARSRV